ncbi:unnamed protein product [Schistosoma curassoni]|uniref:Reverse transcriptase domain-containing protein n=1 Tax=Schistosoma curassoni TaxID=6186 RepID=A0A183JH03_9TREM|nr:unnamed protein product [Schistosoma curassoni]
MPSKEARNALTGWESHGSRIFKASLRTKEGITMNVIECHVRNNDSNDDNNEANKQVEESITADTQKYVENLATIAENAAREGKMKRPYDTTKKLVGKYNKSEAPVKDKEGNMNYEIQEQSNIWVERIEELLNKPASRTSKQHTDIPVDVTPPTIEEIRMAIVQVEGEKSTAPHSISAEEPKSHIEATANMLQVLFWKI